MEIIKKNITLVLGISIPILMILFVAGSIYLPGIFIKPKYDFLYLSGDDYYYGGQNMYSVQNDRLVKNIWEIGKNDARYSQEPKLFIHDIAKNESREISFEEAQKLNLDSNIKSPDGFEVVYGSKGDGIFPFFFYSSTDYNTRYLKGHNVSKKLNIQLSGSYSYNFRFLGWIK